MDEFDIELINEEMDSKFGLNLTKQSLRLMAYVHGINSYPPKTQQCMKFFEKEIKLNNLSLDQVLEFYNLKKEVVKDG